MGVTAFGTPFKPKEVPKAVTPKKPETSAPAKEPDLKAKTATKEEDKADKSTGPDDKKSDKEGQKKTDDKKSGNRFTPL